MLFFIAKIILGKEEFFMKIKKILTTALVCASLIPATLSLTGCQSKGDLNINAKNVYAMCAASSVEYLKNLSGAGQSMTVASSATRPTMVEDSDVESITNSLAMFDNIIAEGLSQTTNKNTSEDPTLIGYTFVMDISFENTTYKMYYNEINTKTSEEVDDEGVELETSSTIQGVMVVDGVTYTVSGEREFETEGDESESSIEFITYLDSNNYVVYEQSVENDEIEYEYSIYVDGQKIQETELEIEKERSGYTIDFQSTTYRGTTNTTEYEIKEGTDGLVINLRKNKSKETIIATKTADGYNFTYSNGFVEEI